MYKYMYTYNIYIYMYLFCSVTAWGNKSWLQRNEPRRTSLLTAVSGRNEKSAINKMMQLKECN